MIILQYSIIYFSNFDRLLSLIYVVIHYIIVHLSNMVCFLFAMYMYSCVVLCVSYAYHVAILRPCMMYLCLRLWPDVCHDMLVRV